MSDFELKGKSLSGGAYCVLPGGGGDGSGGGIGVSMGLSSSYALSRLVEYPSSDIKRREAGGVGGVVVGHLASFAHT